MLKDTRVDAYIERQADFAKPILSSLRDAVHAACPECTEAIKWSMPAFLYRGKQLAGMAAFKAHATFGFWRGAELMGAGRRTGAMGQFGRLTSVTDLPPPEELARLIREAMSLIDSGSPSRRGKVVKAALETPPDLLVALDGNPAAMAAFTAFPPSCRRDYVEWVMEAKRPETRARRIDQAVAWMAEGKRRHWKYESC